MSPKDPSDATHSCAMSFDNFVQVNSLASHYLVNQCVFPTYYGIIVIKEWQDIISIFAVTCLVLS